MSTENKEQYLDIVTPNGRLLIEEIEVVNKTSGGILLASSVSDPDNTCRLGKIIYNGILISGKPDTLYQEGNKVYFGKYGGSTIKHEGKVYISLTVNEISAVAV